MSNNHSNIRQGTKRDALDLYSRWCQYKGYPVLKVRPEDIVFDAGDDVYKLWSKDGLLAIVDCTTRTVNCEEVPDELTVEEMNAFAAASNRREIDIREDDDGIEQGTEEDARRLYFRACELEGGSPIQPSQGGIVPIVGGPDDVYELTNVNGTIAVVNCTTRTVGGETVPED